MKEFTYVAVRLRSNKSYTCFICFLLMVTMVNIQTSKAQNKRKTVLSFISEAPDTVEQGVPFHVSYTLTATHWDKWKMSDGANGIALSHMNYVINQRNGYNVLVITAVANASKTGDYDLPSIMIPIDGMPTRSAVKRIFVKPNTSYGEEIAVAQQCLVDHGMSLDSISLRLEQSVDDLRLFVNNDRRGFAIVANKKLWSIIGNPVLAFSTTDGFYIKEDNRRGYNALISSLVSQLKSLSTPSETTSSENSRKNRYVRPLLGSLMWGQSEPYNQKAPTMIRNKKKAVIGCVPLAAAMIMNYHKWPEKGLSHVYYKPDNTTYSMDFTKCQPQWHEYKDNYAREDNEGASNLSHLLVSLGMAVDASFSNEATGATLGHVKHALCNNFAYSGKMRFRHEGLTDEEVVNILYQELDEGRPCLVSNGFHAFVCDGYEGDFFHFNLGWNGNFNGYYRLKLGDIANSDGKNLITIKSIIYGIQPEKNTLECTVTLQKAGTLTEMLTQEQKENCTSLIIKGPLNSSDILLLRHMAGANNDKFFQWTGGALRHLDMSDASIVNDKQPYIIQKATGTWSRTEQWRDVFALGGDVHYGRTHAQSSSYNLERRMDDKEWAKFKREIGSKQDGFFYTRDDSGRCHVNYYCTKRKIGGMMFSNCSSLNSIIIPSDTKAIEDYAFVGCTSLMKFRVPSHVVSLGKKLFYYCFSLEKIEIPLQFQGTCNDIVEECSPFLKEITKYST